MVVRLTIMIVFSGVFEKSINYSTPQSKFASWARKGLTNMASSKKVGLQAYQLTQFLLYMRLNMYIP